MVARTPPPAPQKRKAVSSETINPDNVKRRLFGDDLSKASATLFKINKQSADSEKLVCVGEKFTHMSLTNS